MSAISAKEYHRYRCEELERLGGSVVAPLEFYQSIFRGRVERVPVFVAGEGIEKLQIEDALHFAVNRDNVYINPCDYFKGWVSDATLKTVFAFVVDLDNIEMGGFEMLFEGFPRGMEMPTYIVNSGKGLHFYYVLEQPVEAYRRYREVLNRINKEISADFHRYAGIGKADTHGIKQAYRIVGSRTKAGCTTAAYRFGGLHRIEDLAARYGLSLEEQPEEHGPVIDARSRFTGVQKRHWTPNKAFYDYTLKRAFEDSHEGHRYTTMFALVQIAAKCQVPIGQVQQDLELLRAKWNGEPKKKAEVKVEEVTLALKGYNDKGNLSPRASLEHFLGWKFDAIKRNGRPQKIHLQLARTMLKAHQDMGLVKKPSEKSKEKLFEYLRENPTIINKSQIARAIGLSRPTVIKYYDETKARLALDKKE
ncbi:hypothetical protein LJC56_11365 [Christensenellaceae bacterium OttesenSCG-928-K19]|nr:hypothetical protein [Christensenellaceae bacterium OttesenSCG-928-K19]